ncbi:50S ribosomal protein L3 [Petrotoga mexicana DSM 14811]|uniref:Large ribosomal subunit protein uL3 n=3 Tax=Petrotoga TaxID=28236 RepID=A0A2K1PDS6_9BACT|nr:MULTISPECIES: 50S ribosomal protein L3 [Petrotoga]MDN5345992.1 large subunit ribosomal protein [Petrotoga sp.]PNR91919.1 50S ribosomal protein L3 [Petrotoga sp. HWHPT.55.6.3]PNS00028.1 50S ribosomal protein L3 [Petrotoga miotherma DSM 10691]PNS00936.1 50S ribosomal protein L3 [Petrotoga mexicana DSM 14811]POZ92813.1 50S ribosomal protein L3 [Petrotoga halophila DSM 16923]
MKSILGKKVAMTRIFKDDKAIPVTVIKAGPCVVVQKKTVETDGYNAIQIGFEEIPERKANKPLMGHFKKAQVQPMRYLREFRVDNVDDYEIGQKIDVSIFSEGEKIDLIGKSKGRGYSGVMKRWNFSGGEKTHGSKFHRDLGSTGNASYPSKVFKGKKMAGQYGNERVTIQNSEVVYIDVQNNLIAVKGGVPGARGGLVTIREAVKAKRPKMK